jgi:hypothetical protein
MEGNSQRPEEVFPGVRMLLRAWMTILEAVRSGLLGLAAAIPASPGEMDPAMDLEEVDESTDLRSVLRIVAEDDLRPAVEALRTLLREESR